MATFDPYSDSPHKIKREGQEIVVRQHRLSPTTIRVSWTIPDAVSCALPTAYNGALVTLDRTPTTLEKLPMDGTLYTADETASINLHAGDKIGTALVVGAFYNDLVTSYVDINDAGTEEPYYVSVHAVDNVHRYHTDGVHSYALPLGKKEDIPTSGYQLLKMGAHGVEPSDLTKLSASETYSFDLHLDGSDPDHKITIHGSNAQTYGAFITALNNAFVKLDKPFVGLYPPLDGQLWFDASKRKVYEHDGIRYMEKATVLVSPTDPSAPNVGAFWITPSTGVVSQWNGEAWVARAYHKLNRDPRNPYCNDYWFDGTTMYKWNGGAWIVQRAVGSILDPQLPPIMNCGMYWLNKGELFNWDEAKCKWVLAVFTTVAPAAPVSGDVWYDMTVPTAKVWDSVDGMWVAMPTFVQDTDPSLAVTPAQGLVWHELTTGAYYKLDGTSWVEIFPVFNTTKPQVMADGALWLNTHNNTLNRLNMGMWVQSTFVSSETAPNAISEGSWWFSSGTNLAVWTDGVWVVKPFVTTPQTYKAGSMWFNTYNDTLHSWSGKGWDVSAPRARASFDAKGNIMLTARSTGSTSDIYISALGNLFNGLAMSPLAMPQHPMKGLDPVSSVPTYMQLGVGTDGSQDERRALVETIKATLGWPAIEVELTKEQMDVAIDSALERFRMSSSSAYKRGYFPLTLLPRVQKYKLTDATVGFNKVVDIFYVYRAQATFLGSAQGNSVYGQMAVQQLFNMGKFDLLSYHMVSSYIKTMQQLFAAEIMFGWDEGTRVLQIMKDFPVGEKVLIDGMIERTEQDLITDRWTRNWIRKYATAQCRYMLAEIRGKFSSLPGAGGAISLNASDLRAAADKEMQECQDDIDNFVANDKVEFGLATDFVLG